MKTFIPLCLSLLLLCACNDDNGSGESGESPFTLQSIVVGSESNLSGFTDVSPDAQIELVFSDAVNETTISGNILLTSSGNEVDYTYELPSPEQVTLTPVGGFQSFTSYRLVIYPSVKSVTGVALENGKVCTIEVGMDDTDKFERISDDELLTLVQQQTFKYFWDFGHPVSGMARERSTSGNTVTTGGTGFGVMSMVVAVERGFVSRTEALQRVQQIVTFLSEQCTSYYGAFSHWINGETGYTRRFSTYDAGADLVEIALLFQGLLTVRAYFDGTDDQETALRTDITALWEAIDWTWFQQNGQNALYWHWSPNYGWQMNMTISGWNEALIAYVLAASSPTHPIDREVYDEGWARNGGMKNGQSFYGIVLPLGSDLGGPLFLSQYSFLGLNPNGLTDQYADYLEQNRNHTLINYSYCVENPNGFSGYSADCWGLTASDGNTGYSAWSPTNDQGVIAPTAALSAFPYTPEQSMAALHFFYYKLGDRLWKDYGFIDAFNLTEGWYDDQYIAIDQGPIICMIENYRTGLLWKLFMSIPEVQQGLAKLGFESSEIN